MYFIILFSVIIIICLFVVPSFYGFPKLAVLRQTWKELFQKNKQTCFFSPSLAHEGSEGFCWDITAGSDQTAGPDCVLPGSRDQGHTPELLLRPEGPAELTLPD